MASIVTKLEVSTDFWIYIIHYIVLCVSQKIDVKSINDRFSWKPFWSTFRKNDVLIEMQKKKKKKKKE